MGKEYVMSIELPDGAKCVRTEISEESVKVIIYTSEESTANVVEQTTQAAVNNTESIEAVDQKRNLDDVFRWIDVTEIKKYDFGEKREDEHEEELRQNILNARENYTSKGFYAPIYEPSLDADGNIQFVAGVTPAVGHSAV